MYEPESVAQASTVTATRALRLGLTTEGLMQAPFAGVTGTGAGITASYDFLISDGFSLALAASYRRYPGISSLQQVGYGALLRHRLLSLGSHDQRLYAAYGILLQTTSVSGQSGSGTSHDTRLTLGADFRVGKVPLYAETSYHFSRLRFLNVDSMDLDYWEAGLGWRTAW
jgi:hypothetical protein